MTPRVVRIWRLDSSDTTKEYPYVCDAVIRTGHRANIFNTQMLPHSNRIASVAGDKQVRIFDIGDIVSQAGDGRETLYTARQANVRILRCHSDSVKRITTEGTPDVFLTVSEDGTVRQHDLRAHHNCQNNQCPAPLVEFSHSLSTLSMSPLTPYQFVVAGESPYGFLFDRRQIGRHLEEEWGMPPDSRSVTTCVRRFGREARSPGESRGYPHITGVRMASDNGHEVLCSYSTDAVYLYSTRDDPHEPSAFQGGILASNDKGSQRPSPRQNADSEMSMQETPRRMSLDQLDTLMEQDIDHFLSQGASESQDGEGSTGSHEQEGVREDQDEDMVEEDDDDDEGGGAESFTNVPIILPCRKYTGACNIETVKDVNFLGPSDEFVVSGSDDGNFFIWDKASGKLCDILEGDGHVVNVIEGHPYLPLIAVSGIDTTVKLFAPTHGQSAFSRLENSDAIINHNEESSSRRVDLATLMMYARVARRAGIDGDECTTQ
ncbi:unnamed protein product [Somion occarium]|uniref:WD40 repeat-like protein n=1 Tax=Somion occarium TaxID=3059160 RepID=A0ABP1CYF2_9APHY